MVLLDAPHDLVGANGVHVAEWSAAERREADAEDRADVAVACTADDALLEAARRLVDQTYVQCMQRLLVAGNYPGLATHDEAIIAEAKRFVAAQQIPRDRFEFQMLYGVRRDLQEGLVKDGYRVRVYVPFGTQWYPYLMRRLAERPANVAFITGNVLKEMLGRVQ